MRIFCDIDGTLTDFEKFVKMYSPQYMQRKYGWEIDNPYGYDIEQLFSVKEKLSKFGLNTTEKEHECEKIVEQFWNTYYLKYLFTPMRFGVHNTSMQIKKQAWELIIITSRKKATERNILGTLVYLTIRLQLWLNGVYYKKLIICANDFEKIEAIKECLPDVLIDDKPEIIDQVGDIIPTICIKSSYNMEQKKAYCTVDGFNNNIFEALSQIGTIKRMK